MKVVRFIYNQPEDFQKFQELAEKYQFQYEAYNENKGADKKKARVYKAACGAVMLPFISIYVDHKIKKAFYQDGNKNALEDFNNYLKGKKKLDLKPFQNLVNYFKEQLLELKEVLAILIQEYDKD